MGVKDEGMPMPDPMPMGMPDPEPNNNNMVFAGIVGSERDPRLYDQPHMEAGLQLPEQHAQEEEEETDPLLEGPTPPKIPRLDQPAIQWIGHICPTCNCNPQGQWAWHDASFLVGDDEQVAELQDLEQEAAEPEVLVTAAAVPHPGADRRGKSTREVADLTLVPTGNRQIGVPALRGVPDPS